jgi:hypothetical protein
MLNEKAKKSAALVEKAEYEIALLCYDFKNISKKTDELLSKESVIIWKKDREVEIRGDIHALCVSKKGIISMTVSAGSGKNVKPESVLGLICEDAGDFRITRRGLVLKDG